VRMAKTRHRAGYAGTDNNSMPDGLQCKGFLWNTTIQPEQDKIGTGSRSDRPKKFRISEFGFSPVIPQSEISNPQSSLAGCYGSRF